MLFTVSPILKEIYCESHRYEPWAVCGNEEKYGEYKFENSLYIKSSLRDELLSHITKELQNSPEYLWKLINRYKLSSIRLKKYQFLASKGDYSYDNIRKLIDETCRVLSCGIFKEVFEPEQAMSVLAAYIPVKDNRDKILSLYQPLCIPHFLKYELKLLYFSEKYAEKKDEKWIFSSIERNAHFSRFLIEDTPYDNSELMKEQMENVIARCGGNPLSVKKERLRLLKHHRETVKNSILAGRDILQAMDDFATYQLRSKIIVNNIIRFIQFIATFEELKHIFTVQTGKIIKDILKKKRMDIEKADIKKLLNSMK